MKTAERRTFFLILSVLALVLTAALWQSCPAPGGEARALSVIRADDMRFHMKFLSSPEFRGRNTPSVEQDIASRYIALTAEGLGLKPVMADGSFFQEVPVEVTSLTAGDSSLRLVAGGRERVFCFPEDVTAGRNFETGRVEGELVLLGLGVIAPELGWDDASGVDLKGKVAVVLDADLPEDHPLKPRENRRLLAGRPAALKNKGAAGLVTVISPERERRLQEKGLSFDLPERLRFPGVTTANQAAPQAQAAAGGPNTPFLQVEVRHEVAAALLGLDADGLKNLFEEVASGGRPATKSMPGRRIEMRLNAGARLGRAFNVVGLLKGGDPVLAGEYVTISSHHDHNPVREGRVFPGADDNLSGVVAMFEIAEAMKVAGPKRSVVFVWNTAEEKGLVGSYYFVQHCPVPVEKVSANLNLDMISRNDPGHIYLIGSNKLSSELDESIKKMNERPGFGLTLDYKYEDPGHPDRFFFRSDQYPYIRFGIPAVWFFCGTTEDYHQETDTESKVDYAKMEKVARLVYLVAMDVGGRPGLLKLDLHPEVRTRGAHNMKVAWR